MGVNAEGDGAGGVGRVAGALEVGDGPVGGAGLDGGGCGDGGGGGEEAEDDGGVLHFDVGEVEVRNYGDVVMVICGGNVLGV